MTIPTLVRMRLLAVTVIAAALVPASASAQPVRPIKRIPPATTPTPPADVVPEAPQVGVAQPRAIKRSDADRHRPWWYEPATSWAYTHFVDGSATTEGFLSPPGGGGIDFVTCLDHPRLNGHPEAIIQVTPTMSPDALGFAPSPDYFRREAIVFTSPRFIAEWQKAWKLVGGTAGSFPLPEDRWCIRLSYDTSDLANGQCEFTGYYVWPIVPAVHCRPSADSIVQQMLPMLRPQFAAYAWNVTFSIPPVK